MIIFCLNHIYVRWKQRNWTSSWLFRTEQKLTGQQSVISSHEFEQKSSKTMVFDDFWWFWFKFMTSYDTLLLYIFYPSEKAMMRSSFVVFRERRYGKDFNPPLNQSPIWGPHLDGVNDHQKPPKNVHFSQILSVNARKLRIF